MYIHLFLALFACSSLFSASQKSEWLGASIAGYRFDPWDTEDALQRRLENFDQALLQRSPNGTLPRLRPAEHKTLLNELHYALEFRAKSTTAKNARADSILLDRIMVYIRSGQWAYAENVPYYHRSEQVQAQELGALMWGFLAPGREIKSIKLSEVARQWFLYRLKQQCNQTTSRYPLNQTEQRILSFIENLLNPHANTSQEVIPLSMSTWIDMTRFAIAHNEQRGLELLKMIPAEARSVIIAHDLETFTEDQLYTALSMGTTGDNISFIAHVAARTPTLYGIEKWGSALASYVYAGGFEFHLQNLALIANPQNLRLWLNLLGVERGQCPRLIAVLTEEAHGDEAVLKGSYDYFAARLAQAHDAVNNLIKWQQEADVLRAEQAKARRYPSL